MAESKVVTMGICCLGEECKGCPELEIEVNGYIAHGAIGGMAYMNHLRCEHVDRCVRIAGTVEKKVRKNCNPDNEKDGV